MVQEIYVSQPLTIQRIMELLELHPDLVKIKCPPSLFARISPRYLDALENLGVVVEPEKRMGRPPKYGDQEVKKIDELLSQGKTPQEIARETGIPLKSVYPLIQKTLTPGRPRKYGTETVQRVKKLHMSGRSARDISEQLDIPLRSVYFLIKK
jgi:hypothetical protein